VRFRLGPVWDRSQVEPLPAPAQPVALDPPIVEPEGDSLGWAFSPLAEIVGELGCSLVVKRHPHGRGGCFIPELGIVSLNEANRSTTKSRPSCTSSLTCSCAPPSIPRESR